MSRAHAMSVDVYIRSRSTILAGSINNGQACCVITYSPSRTCAVLEWANLVASLLLPDCQSKAG